MITNIRKRISQILEKLNDGAYEREETIALALLSALAGESIFLLGLPGVGKSMVARRLKLAFRNASSFEYLMSRFSTPDEIFGPVSISKLKDSDCYERMVEGYLPTADIVFLDEIWKAGPAIQNALLTVLNERIFRNGSVDLQLPLKAVISASNELPAEGEGLEALWDRFLIRYVVLPIRSQAYFKNLILNKSATCVLDNDLPFSEVELEFIKTESEKIVIPSFVVSLICEVRDALNSARQDDVDGDDDNLVIPPYVSDRRWRKIMGILKMSAFLNGRKEVDLSDCLLLEHMLWDHDVQIPAIRQLVAKAITLQLKQFLKDACLDVASNNKCSHPIGDLISKDGKHYSFTVSDEDIMISKTDYNSLTSDSTYANITSDSTIILSPSRAPFTVQKLQEGTITINNLTYYLHRKSALRSGSVQGLIDDIIHESNNSSMDIDFLISQNLFLSIPGDYIELSTARRNMNKEIFQLKY